MMNPPIGALWGIPFLRLAILWFGAVGGGVDGLKLWTFLLTLRRPWTARLLLLYESSESSDTMEAILSFFFSFTKFFDVPTICGSWGSTRQLQYFINESGKSKLENDLWIRTGTKAWAMGVKESNFIVKPNTQLGDYYWTCVRLTKILEQNGEKLLKVYEWWWLKITNLEKWRKTPQSFLQYSGQWSHFRPLSSPIFVKICLGYHREKMGKKKRKWKRETGDSRLPCSPESRTGRNRGGYARTPRKCWWRLCQAWAESARSRRRPLRCLWCMSEPLWCPTPSESPRLWSHHGTTTSLSVDVAQKRSQVCYDFSWNLKVMTMGLKGFNVWHSQLHIDNFR